MNKSIRQNWRIFNKVRLAPIGLTEPDGLSDINQWAELVWNHLCDDELKRQSHHSVKGKKGYTISVWTDDKYVYLVQVVRSEYNTDETIIFMSELTEQNLNDFKAMAKFIRYNIREIIGHSKSGVQEANKLAAALSIKKQIDGEA